MVFYFCTISDWEQWSEEAKEYNNPEACETLDQKEHSKTKCEEIWQKDKKNWQRKRIDTGMHKRKDQVIRDLLRKIKRVYKKAFYETTTYLKSEKDVVSLYRCLVEFAEQKISEIDSEKIAFSLGCMMFKSKMKDMIYNNCFTFIQNEDKRTYLSIINIIQSPFKRFNMKTLRSLVNSGEMATVLTHFPEILNLITILFKEIY